MHKLFLGTILSLLALITVSCDLDQFPEDSISTGTAWETIDDAVKFRNGIYSTFRTVNGGIYTYTADYQADLFNATISFSNRGGDMYRWDFSSSQYDIEDIYEFNYVCINNCNNILQNIDNLVLTEAEDKEQAENIKGEAYLMRAICYHTLAIRFAKDYEPATASTDLGLPLVLEPAPEGKPDRTTLAATYEQIKKDIASARTYLKTQGQANAIYFTTDVIDAFEARVDLYMHDYTNALSIAQKVIAKYPLDTDTDSFAKMWLNDESSEVLFKVFQSPDERTNDIPYYLNYSTGTSMFSPDFVPTQWVLDLYEDEDIRKDVFFLKDSISCLDEKVNDVYMLNKYPGNPALKKKEHEYYQMPKIFRAAEAYLIAAEAAYNEGNSTGALAYLNQLRTARGASLLNLSGDAVLTAIKEEWVREFIGEGQRLNDLKRWHEGFQRHGTQNPTIIMSGANYNQKSVQANDQRFVWEIPSNDLKANSNLIPNWK